MSDNPKEIVFVDGRTDPTFVIIFKDNHDVHYFYWPYEFTASKQFPKPNDVEPIKKKDSIFLSRYHYYGLTVWLDPKIHESKAVCFFASHWHTPIILNNKKTIKTVKLRKYEEIELIERIKYWLGKWYFEVQIKKAKLKNPREYKSKITIPLEQPFEEEKLFDKNFIKRHTKELIIIGNENQVNEFITKITNDLCLDVDKIAIYLNFS